MTVICLKILELSQHVRAKCLSQVRYLAIYIINFPLAFDGLNELYLLLHRKTDFQVVLSRV